MNGWLSLAMVPSSLTRGVFLWPRPAHLAADFCVALAVSFFVLSCFCFNPFQFNLSDCLLSSLSISRGASDALPILLLLACLKTRGHGGAWRGNVGR